MQTAFEIYLKPAKSQSAKVSKQIFLAHTQPEHYFNFHHHPAAGLWAFPPCCTLPVMFSRRQSSLNNLSHPTPWLFLAQDTFCITTDVTATTCHSPVYLCCSAPLNLLDAQPHFHQVCHPGTTTEGNHRLRRGKGSGLCVMSLSVKKARG